MNRQFITGRESVANRTLDVVGRITEILQEAVEEAEESSFGVRSEDGSVAVNVGHNGQLRDVWLRPGVLDSLKPSELARQINVLLNAAGSTAVRQNAEKTSERLAEISEFVCQLPDEDELFPFGR